MLWREENVRACPALPPRAGAGLPPPSTRASTPWGRAQTQRKLTVFFIFSTKLLSLTEAVLKNKSTWWAWVCVAPGQDSESKAS